MVQPPHTGCTILLVVVPVWFLLFLSCQACFKSSVSTIPPAPQEPTMSFVHKLKLEHPQRVKVTQFLQEIQRQQDQLKLVYRQEDYADLNTDEKIHAAKNLLKTNVPAATLLLKDLYEDQLSTKQKLQCLHHLYVVYMAHGPLTEGLKYSEEQYNIPKSALSDSSTKMTPSEIQQLQFQAACDVGNANCFLGNLDKAKIFLDEGKEIASKMADQEKVTLATIYHGNWLLAGGQLKIAMNEVYRPLLRGTLSDYNKGLMLQGFGNACRSAADWGPAKDYLRESIAIAETLNDSVAVADRQGDLGTVYRSEGRTADALEYQQKHYQYAKMRGDRAGLSVACFNLGFTYFSSKPPQLNSAVIYHTVQLELSHAIGLPGMKSRALNCLGKVFTSLANFDGAIQLFNECVDLHSQTGNVGGLGMAYGNLGTAYRALAKYDDAVMYHEKYRENARERDDVGGVAIMQREIALDYMFKENYEMAENSVKEALVTLEQIRMKLGPEDTSRIANYEKNQAETYNLLQAVLVKQGKTKEALALSERGRARALADIIHSKLKDDQGQRSKIELLDEVLVDSEDATNILKLVKKLNITLLVYSVVTEFSEQSKSSKWVYIWVVTMGMKGSDGEPSVHFAKRQLTRGERDKSKIAVDDQNVNSLCRSLGNLNIDGNTQEEQEEMGTCNQETPLESECQKDELQRDIGHRYNPESQLTDLHTADLNIPNKKSQENQKSSPFLKLTEDSQKHQESDDSSKQHDDGQKKEMDSFRANYDLFIAPIEDFLPKVKDEDEAEAPKIVIIPQGFLFNLPFCALLDRNRKHLVQKYTLSFAPSIQVLQLTHHRLEILRQQNTKAPPSVFAIGNPRMPHPRIVSLPAANREVQMVKGHFENLSRNTEAMMGGGDWTESVVATGGDATVDFVKEHMSKHDVLHIATHAEQDEGIAEMIKEGLDHIPRKPSTRGDFSMRGFLVLARTNETCKGLLTAEEIKSQDLKAELAVLSCCQTGMGQVTGDGVLGLYRSFLAAGVASVVITHWKIYDKATAKFMQHFYEAYKVHRDPAKALRSAMLKMLDDKRHHGPQFWAAFAVIGASAIIS